MPISIIVSSSSFNLKRVIKFVVRSRVNSPEQQERTIVSEGLSISFSSQAQAVFIAFDEQQPGALKELSVNLA